MLYLKDLRDSLVHLFTGKPELEDLIQLLRRSTNKDLSQPDAGLNQQVGCTLMGPGCYMQWGAVVSHSDAPDWWGTPAGPFLR